MCCRRLAPPLSEVTKFDFIGPPRPLRKLEWRFYPPAPGKIWLGINPMPVSAILELKAPRCNPIPFSSGFENKIPDP
jgi:hypothetical protein